MPFYQDLQNYSVQPSIKMDGHVIGEDVANDRFSITFGGKINAEGKQEFGIDNRIKRLTAMLDKSKKDLQGINLGLGQDLTKLSIKERGKFLDGSHKRSLEAIYRKSNDALILEKKVLSRQGIRFKGDGLDVDSMANVKKVLYDYDLEKQNATKLKIKNGLFYIGVVQNTEPEPLNKFMVRPNTVPAAKPKVVKDVLFDTSRKAIWTGDESGFGKAIFVLSKEGNFHVAGHKIGQYHHSSLLAGGDVAGAGCMKVVQGKLTWIANKSGHYQPSVDHFLYILYTLQNSGVDMDFSITLHDNPIKGRDFPVLAQWMAERQQEKDEAEAAAAAELEAYKEAKNLPNFLDSIPDGLYADPSTYATPPTYTTTGYATS